MSRRSMSIARALLAITMLASVAALACPLPAAAQETTRTFPETGHTVRGRFLQYWDEHGGLAQQGYPLSEEMTEVSDTDGKPYTVQYFERAVFELHRENQPPYDVLLTLLGTFEYKERYGIAGAYEQHINSDNPRPFPETGHSVGGKFRAYWEQHGGLAQQGYPISDELTEVSPLDGKRYTVQYFQRAVFELHPENAGTAYEVLLSQLGTFRQRAHMAGAALPAPGPNRRQFRPLGSANALVWSEMNLPPADGAGRDSVEFRALDPSSGRLQFAGDTPVFRGEVGDVALDGSLLAWIHGGPGCPPECNSLIVARDLASGQQYNIATTPALRTGVVAGGGRVMWLDRGVPNQRLLAYTVASGSTDEIANIDVVSNDYYPGAYAISGGYAVWIELVSTSAPFSPYRIQARDLATGQVQTVYEGRNTIKDQAVGLSLDGSRLVWTDPLPHYLDLSAGGSPRDLGTDYATQPLIRGDTVLWSGKSGPDSADLDLIGMRLSDAAPRVLFSGGGNQVSAAIAGPWLVWQNDGGPLDNSLGRSSLDAAFSDAAPLPAPTAPAPLNTKLASGPRVGGNWVLGTEVENTSGVISTVLYGYNSATGERRQITNYLDSTRNLYFGDGQRVAWVEGDGNIAVNDLATGVITHVVQLADPHAERLTLYALADGVLYYGRQGQSASGFYALNLADKQQQLITDHGVFSAIAADGNVVWTEMLTGPGKSIPPTFATHLYRGDSSSDTLLPTGTTFYPDIQISGDRIVWTVAPDAALVVYSISSGATRTLPLTNVSNPQLRGDDLVWTEAPTRSTFGWAIRSMNLATGAAQLLRGGIWPQASTKGITADRQIVYTIDNGPYAGLYLTPLP